MTFLAREHVSAFRLASRAWINIEDVKHRLLLEQFRKWFMLVLWMTVTVGQNRRQHSKVFSSTNDVYVCFFVANSGNVTGDRTFQCIHRSKAMKKNCLMAVQLTWDDDRISDDAGTLKPVGFPEEVGVKMGKTKNIKRG